MDSYDMENEVTDKYSLRGKVFHKIRDNILDGQYSQHEELRENTLARELGVSRTPVREALRQLELEGLVTIIPNKGAHVNRITPQDVQDIYRIRARLEGLCAAMATERISREQLEEMESTICLSYFHEQHHNYDKLYALDTQFHKLLYHASGSKMLEHLLIDFHQYVQRVRRTTLAMDGRAVKSTREHENILNAIKEKNPERADELTTLHIMNTINNINHYKIESLLDAETTNKQEDEPNEQD